jgi:hypothetical protein
VPQGLDCLKLLIPLWLSHQAFGFKDVGEDSDLAIKKVLAEVRSVMHA